MNSIAEFRDCGVIDAEPRLSYECVIMDSSRADTEQATLLVVGDDRLFSHQFRDALENMGYRVLIAPNREEALGAFLRFRPDLILSDTSMPDLNGLRLLKEVRATPEGDTVPFILIYPGVRKADISYAESMGAHCIVSPFHMQDLLSAVQACLERSDGVRDSKQ